MGNGVASLDNWLDDFDGFEGQGAAADAAANADAANNANPCFEERERHRKRRRS